MNILIATNNPSKYKEIVAVWGEKNRNAETQKRQNGPASIEWLSLNELATQIAEPHENGSTFAENAALKARYYSKAAGLWALADDSGLEVDALGGEPGVHSAYYAREVADQPRAVRDAANNARLVAALRGIPPEKRSARFRCCLALANGEQILATAEGAVEGVIVDSPRGTHGFGYDPHFFIPELGKTTAELTSEEKNRISHRGQALRVMRGCILQLAGDSSR